MESIIQKILKRLLDRLGADYDCVTVEEKDGRYQANIGTDIPAKLIGKNGAFLKSLQIILRNILSVGQEENIFVVLDVDGYNAKREAQIIEQAQKSIDFMKAENLKETKLPPMPADVRRIVHLWIAHTYPELMTDSIGERNERAVHVFYK